MTGTSFSDDTDTFTIHKQFTYKYYCTNVLIVDNIMSEEHKKSFPVIVHLCKPNDNIMVMKVWITMETKVKELIGRCNNYMSENAQLDSCYYKHKPLMENDIIFNKISSNENDKIPELKVTCHSFAYALNDGIPTTYATQQNNPNVMNISMHGNTSSSTQKLKQKMFNKLTANTIK